LMAAARTAVRVCVMAQCCVSYRTCNPWLRSVLPASGNFPPCRYSWCSGNEWMQRIRLAQQAHRALHVLTTPSFGHASSAVTQRLASRHTSAAAPRHSPASLPAAERLPEKVGAAQPRRCSSAAWACRRSRHHAIPVPGSTAQQQTCRDRSCHPRTMQHTQTCKDASTP